MWTMLRFPTKKPVLGIEITSSAVTLAAVSGRGERIAVEYAKTADLPAGAVAGNYASPNIGNESVVVSVIRECLSSAPRAYCQAALSLPDNIFRVQTLEFDALPAKKADQDRLIRWRIEKAAAYDLADTILQYQVLRRENGYTVLACAAKRAVITQYESVLRELGLEPWNIGLSSFHVLNFYFPLMSGKSSSFAHAHLTIDSFTTMVAEAGGARFYRFKDLSRVGSGGMKERFMREVEDSLHFYFTHRNHAENSEVRHLYLTGVSPLPDDLAEGISTDTSLSVDVLTPSDLISPSRERASAALPPAVAAAVGAGSAV